MYGRSPGNTSKSDSSWPAALVDREPIGQARRRRRRRLSWVPVDVEVAVTAWW